MITHYDCYSSKTEGQVVIWDATVFNILTKFEKLNEMWSKGLKVKVITQKGMNGKCRWD